MLSALTPPGFTAASTDTGMARGVGGDGIDGRCPVTTTSMTPPPIALTAVGTVVLNECP